MNHRGLIYVTQGSTRGPVVEAKGRPGCGGQRRTPFPPNAGPQSAPVRILVFIVKALENHEGVFSRSRCEQVLICKDRPGRGEEKGGGWGREGGRGGLPWAQGSRLVLAETKQDRATSPHYSAGKAEEEAVRGRERFKNLSGKQCSIPLPLVDENALSTIERFLGRENGLISPTF